MTHSQRTLPYQKHDRSTNRDILHARTLVHPKSPDLCKTSSSKIPRSMETSASKICTKQRTSHVETYGKTHEFLKETGHAFGTAEPPGNVIANLAHVELVSREGEENRVGSTETGQTIPKTQNATQRTPTTRFESRVLKSGRDIKHFYERSKQTPKWFWSSFSSHCPQKKKVCPSHSRSAYPCLLLLLLLVLIVLLLLLILLLLLTPPTPPLLRHTPTHPCRLLLSQ